MICVARLAGGAVDINQVSDIINDSIANLKTKFYLESGRKPDEGDRLFFGTQQLEDDRAFGDYNIRHGCTLVAVFAADAQMTDGLWFCMESDPEMLGSMPDGEVANWVTGSHDIGRVASRVSERRVDHMNMVIDT